MSLSLASVGVDRGGVRVVDDVTLEVPRGRALALLGPSGSGKSSLLHAVAGLVATAAGTVRVDGQDLVGLPPERRGVGLMFQEFALFPHLDVAANVAFGPRMHGATAAEQAARADALLDRVGLGGLGDRDVATLSGGQRQRVALARALATDPAVLLLDEPFGSLDRQLREQLLGEVQALVGGEDGPAVVAVTHDRDEAFTLGDEVAVLREGRVAQVGHPEELLRSPVDVWTARFVGHPNVLDAQDAARLGVRPAGAKHVVVPATAVTLTSDETGAGLVRGVVWRAGRPAVTVEVADLRLTVEPPPGTVPPAVGARVDVQLEPEAAFVVD